MFGFKYETHLHTFEGSLCGSVPGKIMARVHKELGYTGIFVTDHFFNGNTRINRDQPWRDKIEQFCKGYEHAKEEGDRIGLQVFFGFEFGVETADFLVYNLDKQWLLEHEDIDKTPAHKAFAMMHEDGAFIVQAHPFRERGYVDHIHLYPRDVDAVEAINGSHFDIPAMNDRARLYAQMYDLPITSGSDTHNLPQIFCSGVVSREMFKTPLDYLKKIQSGELTLLEPDVKDMSHLAEGILKH